jgi:hypothetical protein
MKFGVEDMFLEIGIKHAFKIRMKDTSGNCD